jgi:hypothetical protein
MRNERLGFFGIGTLAGICFMVACGAVGVFPYRYYSLALPDDCYDRGALLGKQGNGGWKDLPLSTCRPDKGNKLKCITVLDGDFYSAKGDYLKCEQDLSACQKNCK